MLPFIDRGTIYDAELFELMRDAANERGIRWQTKHMVAGGTDAGRIHKMRTGVRTVGVAAPVRYIHSPVSVAAKSDMQGVLGAYRRSSKNLPQAPNNRQGEFCMSKVFELYQTLSAFVCPGREEDIREAIAGIASDYLDEVTTDALGNLICRKKASRPEEAVPWP